MTDKMEAHDLGNDWYAITYPDGRMTLRNNDAGQRIDLGADSVATLKRIFAEISNHYEPLDDGAQSVSCHEASGDW